MFAKCFMDVYSSILSECKIRIEIVFEENVDQSSMNPHHYRIFKSSEIYLKKYNDILDIVKAYHRDYTEFHKEPLN